MRHVGLVADDAGHVDLLEQVHVLAPGLHAAPADLALGDEELAVVLRRPWRPRGTSRRSSWCCPSGPCPRPRRRWRNRCGCRRSGGCRARASAGRCRRPCCTWLTKRLRSSCVAHRRAAAGAAPDRRDERADLQPVAGDVVGHPLHRVLVAVDVEVRRDDEEVDAVEFLRRRPRRWRSAQAACRAG